MTNIVRRWDVWWTRDVPPHALAIFRMLFGACLFFEAVSYLPAVPMLFSDRGLGVGLLSQPPSVAIAYLVACAYVLATVFVAVGFMLRPAVVTLLLLQLYYWQLSFHLFPSSYHRIFFFTLLALLLGGADKTLSLRMKLKRGSWFAEEPIPILPQRLIAVQVTATYLGAGLQKWWLPMWRQGEVLAYPIAGRWGTAFGRWLLSFGPSAALLDRLLLCVKLFETALPFGLWWKPLRRWFFVAGFFFHLVIACTMGLWWFLAMPAAYVLFLEPETVRDAVRKRLWH